VGEHGQAKYGVCCVPNRCGRMQLQAANPAIC
jgi:hypothetical protein